MISKNTKKPSLAFTQYMKVKSCKKGEKHFQVAIGVLLFYIFTLIFEQGYLLPVHYYYEDIRFSILYRILFHYIHTSGLSNFQKRIITAVEMCFQACCVCRLVWIQNFFSDFLHFTFFCYKL